MQVGLSQGQGDAAARHDGRCTLQRKGLVEMAGDHLRSPGQQAKGHERASFFQTRAKTTGQPGQGGEARRAACFAGRSSDHVRR